MYFDEDFIRSLPDDPPSAILQIAKRYSRIMDEGNAAGAPIYELVKEMHAFLSVYLEAKGLPGDIEFQGSPLSLAQMTGDVTADTGHLLWFVNALAGEMHEEVTKRSSEQLQRSFRLMLGTEGFHYEFSEGDLHRIQQLVNELRDLISASDALGADHKRRVLGRLEKLQSELHKKVSDLSWFWGELIEASIAARIMGENAKPVVDRIREIVSVVWPVQARAFELPSDTPFRLPGETEDKP